VTNGGRKQRLSPDRAAAQRAREAAFARLSRVRGATVIGAGALTAAIAGVVSAVAPGRTLGAKTPATAASASTASRPRTTALVMPPLENPGQLGLQGPGIAPQGTQPQGTQPQGTQPQGTQPQPQTQSPPATQAPTVVSGGS
jgi:hypothetical protein